MVLTKILILVAIFCSYISAFNVTYPTTGNSIDRSKSFNITWNLSENDPLQDDGLIIFASFTNQNFLQRIGENVSISLLKYEVPAFTLGEVGTATLIMNTLGTQGNSLAASVLVEVVPGAGNSTQGSGASSTMTSASSTGVAHPALNSNDGVVGAFVAWLAATGIGLLV